jgi:hypothetical protein
MKSLAFCLILFSVGCATTQGQQVVDPAWSHGVEQYCDGRDRDEAPPMCQEFLAEQERKQMAVAALKQRTDPMESTNPRGACVLRAEFDYKECVRAEELGNDECKNRFDVASATCVATYAGGQ